MKINTKILQDYIAITMGSFIFAMGISIFLINANIIPGGVTGLSIGINYLTNEKISVGTAFLIMNIPLSLWGLKVLGKQFIIRTFYGVAINSFFIDLLQGKIPYLEFIRFDDLEAIQTMVKNDFFLFIIAGGILMGLGIGIVLKFQGSTGGFDIVAAIAKKKFNLKPGHVFRLIDFFVIIIGGFILHFKEISPDRPAFTLALYAFVLLFCSTRLIDTIIDGFDYANSAIIISTKYNEIANSIMDKLSRGATAFYGKGLYMNVDRKIIFTVIARREITLLTETVKKIDPKAFMIVNNVHEVLGEGFRLRR